MTQIVKRNVIVAVWQIVVTGVILIILYRELLVLIGVHQLGIWSMVAAVASAVGMAQLGLGGGVVKYVSKYLARSDKESAIRIIQTAAISTVVLLLAGGALLYPLLSWILGRVIDDESVKIAREILPLSITVILITAIAAVFQSGLDGAQRVDLRGYIAMTGSLIYLFCVYLMVPEYGLTGLLYAQLIQAVFLLVASMIILGRVLQHASLFRRRYWGWQECREILSYGVPFQIISVAQIYTDPVTKVLLGYFGGVSAVGYYEMANRMVMQLRTLFIAGNQVLIPVVSTISEKSDAGITLLYQKSFRITYFIAIPFFALVVSLSPFISVLWIGSYEYVFVLSVCLLAISRCINTLSAPAYFSYLGIGKLKPVVTGHIYITTLNLILGGLFGLVVPVIGAIVGWSLALSVGTLYVVGKYHREYGQSLIEVVSREHVVLLLVSVTIAIFCFLIYHYSALANSGLSGIVVTLVLYALVVLPIMLKNPVCHEVLGDIRERAGV